MDGKWMPCPDKHLSCNRSKSLIVLLTPSLKDPRRHVRDSPTLSNLKVSNLSHLRHLHEQSCVRDNAEKKTLSKLSVDALEHQTPAEIFCPKSIQIDRVENLLLLTAEVSKVLKADQQDTLANLPGPTLSFSLDESLPPEIQTNERLPRFIVTLKGLSMDNDEAPLDSENFWGQVSLMSADGRVAMALVDPHILSGGIIAPLVHRGNYWSLLFDDLVIRQPGYFKFHVALMQTSQWEGEDNGESMVEAPRELLSVVTSVIHVHAFAPRPGQASKAASL